MSWEIVTLITIALLFILLSIGLEVAFTLGLIGVIILYLFQGQGALFQVGTSAWVSGSNFVLTSVPAFILMSEIFFRSGIGNQLFSSASKWFRRLPGGLLQASIVCCSIFAATSGSSVACAATVGTVAIPEMEKRNYNKPMIYGCIAGGGTLGILIPPSIPMIIYGLMAEQSVGQLFLAGVVPGIILSILFMTYIAIRVTLKPHLAPKEPATSWRERLVSVKDMAPAVILIAIVLGGIYFGIMTPTEAGAVGAFIALIIGLAYRKMSLRITYKALVNTAMTTSMIFLIVVGASIMGNSLTRLGIPQQLANLVVSLSMSPWVVFTFICIVYLIMGCFLEGIAMITITAPVVVPVLTAIGFDLIWFGIVLVILIEASLITPPVALNLYVLDGLTGGHSMKAIIAGSYPYLVIMAFFICILAIWPPIATWLPSTMK